MFNFDFDDRENFEILFKLIDTSDSGRIGREEMKRANTKYGEYSKYNVGLNLDQKIDIMLNNTGTLETDIISRETLWNLLRAPYPS